MSIFLIATIVFCVVAGAALTLPTLSPAAERDWTLIIAATQIVFLIEYLLRFWVAPSRDTEVAARPLHARLRYLISPLGIIDLVSLLPGLLLVTGARPWFEEVAALLALFKLARYSPALGLLASVIRNERRSLIAAMMALFVLLILAAGFVYLLEREAQPTEFTSIPASLWWAITTMATVGYGDMTPITTPGRIFGGFVMLLGIAMFAVPAGIMATGFASELRRRDFVITWKSVAKVPLFAGLDAGQIATITQLLQPQFVPAGQIVVRRGAAADAMYFIMDGTVEVDVEPNRVRLGAGSYFGEIALLRDSERTATVTAMGDCRLLALSVADFRRLMADLPDLKEKLEETAGARLRGPGQ
ncbi:MAG: cyclic nucleotide-gated ion channel [Rhodospirillaceae bacterium]|nr:cyclic nucleotide-gated ion channel [Rhodospirillaceae bacterium]